MKKNADSYRKLFILLLLALLMSPLSFASVKEMERLLVEQRFQEAYDAGSQLLAEEAGDPNFDMLYGIAASRIAKYDQAIFAFERVLMFDSTSSVARFEFARTHFLLGNLITARHHFNLVLETQPKAPLVIQRRIQWYLATINAKEAGKAVATSGSVNRFYLGARLGHNSNPRNMTYQDVFHPLFGADPMPLPDVDSATFHELSLGANRLQQLSARWGWFLAGDLSTRNYYGDSNNISNYSLGLQGGGILLGSNWRLSIPLQVNNQVRDDKNEVLVLALAADFNQRLGSKADYSIFGQLADIGFKPGKGERDLNSFTTGITYSYRPTKSLRFFAGPLLTLENADEKTNKHLGRELYGARTGLGYSFSDEQRLDFNFSYLSAKHKATDAFFIGELRKDKQMNFGFKFSHRYPNNLLADLSVQTINNDSTLDLYSYRRTQLSAGLRKEW